MMKHWVDLQASDGHGFGGYVCVPEGEPRAGLVIAQEVFGVNPHIQSVVSSYAQEGYLAIAPRFFDRMEKDIQLGYERPDVEKGLAYTKRIDWEQTRLDVEAAVKYLESQMQGKPLGMVGYCWGGSSTWRAAAGVPGLSAAVCYYGGAIPSLSQLKPQCPVLLHWGLEDSIIPESSSRAFAAGHPGVESHFYPADHGFNCDQRASYHEPSARLARQRTLAFIEQHLQIDK